jgi:beta-glucosidase/6-phospho-beta-glucosidase/beta-galactosidase
VSPRPRLFVTLEGYAVEGGFDRPFEPATCYSPTVALGRHAGPGDAAGLWHDYESVLDLVPGLGFEGVRLGVEWARVEPHRGAVDDGAVARYAQVANHARSLGLRVTVVLVDAAWPAWLGLEAWLLPWVVPDMIAHARTVVTRMGDAVTGVVAFAEPRTLVAGGYLNGTVPPWRKGARVDAASADAQIDRIADELRADPVVGPLLVRSTRTVSLDQSPELITRARSSDAYDELYVRTLVKGSGPTAAATGLLVRRVDSWGVDAPEELLSVLR